MQINDREKQFIKTILGSESARETFKGILDHKIDELKDITNFGSYDHEKELGIMERYAGRMSAIKIINDFRIELSVISGYNRDIDPKKTKGRI